MFGTELDGSILYFLATKHAYFILEKCLYSDTTVSKCVPITSDGNRLDFHNRSSV